MKTMLEKLKNNEQTIGSFVALSDPIIAEILAVAGMDYFVIDLEHSSIGSETIKYFFQAANYRKISPLVRVKNRTRSDILRPLDLGAQGIIIPNIKSVEEVKEIISWGKYSPIGERGFSTNRVVDFGYNPELGSISELMKFRNDHSLLIPQAETKESLEIIEDIVSLEGIDGIFIGPFDLSIALGIPGEFNSSIFIEAIEKIVNACRKHKKYLFIFANDKETAKKRINQGFDSVTISMDSNFLMDGAKLYIDYLNN